MLGFNMMYRPETCFSRERIVLLKYASNYYNMHSALTATIANLNDQYVEERLIFLQDGASFLYPVTNSKIFFL